MRRPPVRRDESLVAIFAIFEGFAILGLFAALAGFVLGDPYLQRSLFPSVLGALTFALLILWEMRKPVVGRVTG